MLGKQLRIYCAGPMNTSGSFANNMRMALDVAHELMEHGHFPYVPHLCWHIELAHPKTAEVWMGLDKIWLEQCNALFRIPGESVGADIEMSWAKERGLRIFRAMGDVPYVPTEERISLPKYK